MFRWLKMQLWCRFHHNWQKSYLTGGRSRYTCDACRWDAPWD